MYLCLPYTFVHVIRKRRYCLTLYQYIPVHTYTCTLWYPSILDICFSNLEIKRISESIPFLWWILRNMPFHVQTGKYRPVKPFLRVSKSNTKFATCGAGTSYHKTNNHLSIQWWSSILPIGHINKTNSHLSIQWWSSIPPRGHINKTSNHLSPQIIELKKDHDIWRWKSRPGQE